jgi:hypothetical protein
MSHDHNNDNISDIKSNKRFRPSNDMQRLIGNIMTSLSFCSDEKQQPVGQLAVACQDRCLPCLRLSFSLQLRISRIHQLSTTF